MSRQYIPHLFLPQWKEDWKGRIVWYTRTKNVLGLNEKRIESNTGRRHSCKGFLCASMKRGLKARALQYLMAMGVMPQWKEDWKLFILRTILRFYFSCLNEKRIERISRMCTAQFPELQPQWKEDWKCSHLIPALLPSFKASMKRGLKVAREVLGTAKAVPGLNEKRIESWIYMKWLK